LINNLLISSDHRGSFPSQIPSGFGEGVTQ
jgi:hypothetical protein